MRSANVAQWAGVMFVESMFITGSKSSCISLCSSGMIWKIGPISSAGSRAPVRRLRIIPMVPPANSTLIFGRVINLDNTRFACLLRAVFFVILRAT